MIFYYGNSEKVKIQKEKLQHETEELRGVLLMNDNTNEDELNRTLAFDHEDWSSTLLLSFDECILEHKPKYHGDGLNLIETN